MLIALQNLGTVEQAERTTELADLFISHVKYGIADKGTFVHFAGELEYVEQYLKFQKIRLGSQFNLYPSFSAGNADDKKLPAGDAVSFCPKCLLSRRHAEPGGRIDQLERLSETG